MSFLEEENQGNNREEEEDEEISYDEILANLQLSGEVTVILRNEEIDTAKLGIKNLKAKQAAKLASEGVLGMEEHLVFSSSLSKEYKGYSNLSITLKKRGIIKVKKMIVPDTSL